MVPRSYPTRRPSAKRVLAQVFDLTGATLVGGLNAIGGFVKKLGVDRKLSERFRHSKASWSIWRLDRTLRMLLDAYFAGIERVYHFADLENEPLLCAQSGVERLCDLKTIYRDLQRFENPELLGALHGVLREVVGEALAGHKRVVLELDSTVETLYGHQEGAALGPNPHKPGRPSYHPLLARDRLTDLVVHHVLRPGNTGTASDIKPFLHQTLDIVEKNGAERREILARLDSGFESNDVMALLEWRQVGYVVKMRVTWEVASFVAWRGGWRNVEVEDEGRVQVTSFTWRRPTSWKEPRRIVAVRKREMDSVQGRLFDETGWAYSLYVTNLDWAPEDVARFYDKRADVERTICELKNDLSIHHVPSSSFAANAADLALKVLARNLLVLYRDHGLQLTSRVRVFTLRRRYLLVPGRVVRHAGRVILRLAADCHLAARPQPPPLRC
jgi:hypothetical protein